VADEQQKSTSSGLPPLTPFIPHASEASGADGGGISGTAKADAPVAKPALAPLSPLPAAGAKSTNNPATETAGSTLAVSAPAANVDVESATSPAPKLTPLAPPGAPTQVKPLEPQSAASEALTKSVAGQVAPLAPATPSPAAVATGQNPVPTPTAPSEATKNNNTTKTPVVNPAAGAAVTKKKPSSKAFILTIVIAGIVIVGAVIALFVFVINRRQPAPAPPPAPVSDGRDEISTAEALERIRAFLSGSGGGGTATDLSYSVNPEVDEVREVAVAPCPTFIPSGQSWGTNVVSCAGVAMTTSISGGGLSALRDSARDYVLSLDLVVNFTPAEGGSRIAESFANGTTVCNLSVSPIGFNGLQGEAVAYCADVSGYYKRLGDIKDFVGAFKEKTGNEISLFYATDSLAFTPSSYEPYEFVLLGTETSTRAAFYRTGRNGAWIYSENASVEGMPECATLDLGERRGFSGWLNCSIDGSEDTPPEEAEETDVT